MAQRFLLCLVGFWLILGLNAGVQASSAIDTAKQAVVRVVCDDRQGSGSVINGSAGYVLSAGHVVIDVMGDEAMARTCRVAFADASGNPRYEYRASIIRAVYNEKLNQDFAILQIGSALGADLLERPFPALASNEFSTRGDQVSILGYSGADDRLTITGGLIQDYVGGFIQTDAEIAPGDSGGAGLDGNGNLLGVPSRIVSSTDSKGNSRISYELVDVRAVMNWLDTFASNEHDQFFTHADRTRYHQTSVFIAQDRLGCAALGRTPTVSSVYCLMGDGTRLAFPSDTTYFSWFADFSDVRVFDSSYIADYRLERNATFKPGTLVKLKTAPQVYMVSDSFGTLRWIPSEQRAIELWGSAWAGLVFDIPDEFWVNYKIGQPLE